MSLSDPMIPQATPLQVPPDGRQSERAAEIQRGVGRLFRGLGWVCVYELTIAGGRRADVAALGPQGALWIVEIKSSVEDFRADSKWEAYRASCDRLLFATHSGVPREIFPEDAGLIIADAYGAEIVRAAPEHRLAGATRKALLIRFAQAAAGRLHGLMDPDAGSPTLV